MEQLRVLANRSSGDDRAARDLRVAEVFGQAFFEPQRRALLRSRGEQIVNQLVKGCTGAATGIVEDHRAAIPLRDEDTGGVGVAAVEEQIEVRLTVATAVENDDARAADRCRLKARVKVGECGRKRLEICGELARTLLAATADDVEMLRGHACRNASWSRATTDRARWETGSACRSAAVFRRPRFLSARAGRIPPAACRRGPHRRPSRQGERTGKAAGQRGASPE